MFGGLDGGADNFERVLMFLMIHSYCTHEGPTEGAEIRTFVV